MTAISFVGVDAVHFDGHSVLQVMHEGVQVWPYSRIILPSNPASGETPFFQPTNTVIHVPFNRHGLRVDLDKTQTNAGSWSGYDLAFTVIRNGKPVTANMVFEGHRETMLTTSVGMPPDIPAITMSLSGMDPWMALSGRNIHKGDIIRISYVMHGTGFVGPVTIIQGAFIDVVLD